VAPHDPRLECPEDKHDYGNENRRKEADRGADHVSTFDGQVGHLTAKHVIVVFDCFEAQSFSHRFI